MKGLIGIILVSHGDLGRELIKSAELIVGEISEIAYCSLGKEEKSDCWSEKLRQLIATMETLEGIIILADLYGGTPSNLSMLENRRKNIRTISGVNLGMLLAGVLERETKNLTELAEYLVVAGEAGIKLTSNLLKGGDGSG